MRRGKQQEFEQVQPFDLDRELQKLQEIKAKRERELQSKRELAIKKRQDEINKIFFQRELSVLKNKQRGQRDNYSFFPGQTARLNDVYYNAKNETSLEEFRPNTLGFIYEEKDES